MSRKNNRFRVGVVAVEYNRNIFCGAKLKEFFRSRIDVESGSNPREAIREAKEYYQPEVKRGDIKIFKIISDDN